MKLRKSVRVLVCSSENSFRAVLRRVLNNSRVITSVDEAVSVEDAKKLIVGTGHQDDAVDLVVLNCAFDTSAGIEFLALSSILQDLSPKLTRSRVIVLISSYTRSITWATKVDMNWALAHLGAFVKRLEKELLKEPDSREPSNLDS